MAASRASPSMLSPNMTGVTPASLALRAAASSATCAVASTIVSELASLTSSGSGVSFDSSRRKSCTPRGASTAYLRSTFSPSARVVASPTVGPDAMVDGSSPGTSEINNVTTCAGAAAIARRPAFIADRCLRTQFISAMLAPDLSNPRLTDCLSSSVRPGPGTGINAEPPPEIRQSARSCGPRSATTSRRRPAAARPVASGTGWAASTTSIWRHGTPCPYRVITRPESGPSQCCSTAAAMAAAAFPAPTTTVRPRGGGGR